MLEVVLLGAGQVRRQTTGGDVALPPAATSLLAYLVLHGNGGQSRDALATAFWGELSADAARRRLNTAVWRLRRALEPAPVRRGTYLTVSPSGGIRVNGEQTHVDVTEFESRVVPALATAQSSMTEADAGALAAAVELYRGELLEGSYDEWVVRERERLAELHLAAVARLVVWYQGRDAESALRYAQRILVRDPLREDVHRCVMRAYADLGRRTDAMRQYDACRTQLREELDVDPLPETTALAAAIAQGRSYAAPAVPQQAAVLLERLRHAQEQVHELDDALAQAIATLTGA